MTLQTEKEPFSAACYSCADRARRGDEHPSIGSQRRGKGERGCKGAGSVGTIRRGATDRPPRWPQVAVDRVGGKLGGAGTKSALRRGAMARQRKPGAPSTAIVFLMKRAILRPSLPLPDHDAVLETSRSFLFAAIVTSMSRLKRFTLALIEYRPNPECLKRESYVDQGKFLILALVTDVEWIRPAIAAFQFPIPGKLNVFAPAETASARRRICAAYRWWPGRGGRVLI